jgi:cobalt-zinc-cadmium efflux system membrane fusion protein
MNPHSLRTLLLAALAAAGSLSCAREHAEPGAPPARVAEPAHAHAAGEEPHEPGAATATTAPGGELLVLDPDALRDLRLTTRRVERRAAGDTITALGSLEFDPNRIRAVSTSLAARVLVLSKRVGDRVAEGEVLVELTSVELARAQVALESSSSRIAIAEERRRLATDQRDRVRELVDGRMATVKDLQAAEAELAARTADVSEANATAREAERALEAFGIDSIEGGGRCVLKAAAPGTVIFRDGTAGESVEAGHTFVRIASLSELLAVVHPFERDGARIDESAAVRLSAAAHPGRTFEARFLLAGPQVDPGTRTLPVRLAVPNPAEDLLPGMSVTAEIRLADPAAQEIVTVPLASLQRVDRDWCVFVPRGKGRFERRTVARGRDLGGEVEVLGGLAPDEEVVVEGAFVLRSESTRGAEEGDAHHH